MFVDFNILNQLGSPSINSNTFANRPAAGQTGRLFVSTDTFEIYRDNGTGWDLIGGPGAGTITGTGTATQVAYFTGAQTIGSSANLFWDNTNTRLGIGTATPGVRLDVHGTGTIVQVNATGATSNAYLAFQRTGNGVWRIGDTYNGGNNFFELHNTVLTIDALEFEAATNKSTFLGQQTYASGLATGNQFTYNLTVPNGVNITSPNAVHAVNSYLNLSLGGNTTVPVGARQGLEGNSRISFTGAGTLTMTQGSTVRAFSALSSVYSFNGSAVGTVTHLAGLRICFPDNIGSAINITNNYGLLLNDQTAGLGTVTYTNRWGIYQEGASDLNYFAANMLLGSTTNSGQRLQVTGTALFTGAVTGTGISSTYTVTAASGVARSKSITSTLVAAANNDVLVGLDINPTFTNGAFTGVMNYGARIQGIIFGRGSGGVDGNVAIGAGANSTQMPLGKNTTGSFNIAIGYQALSQNTTGGSNIAIGVNAQFNGTVSECVIIGASAVQNGGANLTTAVGASAFGTGSGGVSGANNVGVGGYAMFSNSSGANNTALGTRAGRGASPFTNANTTGTNNIFIGYESIGVSATDNNRTWIGNSSTTSTWLAGNVLIGTTTDAGFRLDCNGTARVTGQFTGPNGFIITNSNITAYNQALQVTQGTGATLTEVIASVAGGATSIRQSIWTTGGGAATQNQMQFRVYNGGASEGILILRGDGLAVFEDTNVPTYDTSAIVAVNSTTKGFLPPRMTTAQKNAIAAPANGLVIYDTTLAKLCVFTGVNWETVTSV